MKDYEIEEQQIRTGQDFLDSIEIPKAQEWTQNLTSDIDYIIPFDGIARDLQQWILRGQLRRQEALSLCSTLAILSTAKGRALSYGGSIKGNFMMIGLCESGDGKENCLNRVEKVLSQCGNMANLVHDEMSSGAALIESISNPGHTSTLVIDEIGHFFGRISGKKSNAFSAEIIPTITKLYTKADGLYIDKARKGTPGIRIQHPNLTVLGMSSQSQFMEVIDEKMISDGSLARFFIVFGIEDAEPLFHEFKEPLPEHIKTALIGYYGSFHSQSASQYEPEILRVETEYKQEFNDIQKYFYQKALACNGDKNKGIFKPFYKRLAVKAMQMAILIDDCKSIEVLKWSANIVEKSLDIFIKKYNHNVAGNQYENWIKTVERAIKESGTKGITKNDLRIKCRSMPVDVRDKIIKDLLEHEQIFIQQRDGKTKPVTLYFWSK